MPAPTKVATNVLLIRHGQSRGNAERRFGGHTATPLSARGRRQAEATARALKSESLTAIYSSDLARAMETAKPLSNLTRLPINGTPAFRERSVGVMEGLTFEDAAQQHPDQYGALLRRDFEHVLTGGESYRQLLDRSRQKLDEIIAEHRGGRIAVFSHTGTICILALHLIGALDAPELKPVWISSANCGITRFELREDGFVRVLTVNDTSHLGAL
ncbi:MAG TPA: histidine phosphatase family protein [Pyrinomonadaceae bacterium]|jgi:2,3-bisphosphoglycerate-dependent phosphoglycerate mutase|nr:histidine phosphatase family protein [Pyrinomonadaceae bacterium]